MKVNINPEPLTDAEAICDALTQISLPPGTTIVGYDVSRPFGDTENFYWDNDFKDILVLSAFEPIFSIHAHLEELKLRL